MTNQNLQPKSYKGVCGEIIKYLEAVNNWVAKEKITEVIKETYRIRGEGINSETIGRKCRLLEEDGQILVKYVGKTTFYRSKYERCFDKMMGNPLEKLNNLTQVKLKI